MTSTATKFNKPPKFVVTGTNLSLGDRNEDKNLSLFSLVAFEAQCRPKVMGVVVNKSPSPDNSSLKSGGRSSVPPKRRHELKIKKVSPDYERESREVETGGSGGGGGRNEDEPVEPMNTMNKLVLLQRKITSGPLQQQLLSSSESDPSVTRGSRESEIAKPKRRGVRYSKASIYPRKHVAFREILQIPAFTFPRSTAMLFQLFSFDKYSEQFG